MSDIYERLHEKINQLGVGYQYSPEGSSSFGKEFMEYLFSEQDAEIFIALPDAFVTAEQAADIVGKDADEMAEVLFDMSKRGLLYRRKLEDGTLEFHIIPTVHGLIEFNVDKFDDPNFTADFTAYAGESGHMAAWQGTAVPFYRSVPFGVDIAPDSKILPFDDAAAHVRSAKLIVISDCACRYPVVAQGGEVGDQPISSCMQFNDMAQYYLENGIGNPRVVTAEEAFEFLASNAAAGRVTQMLNSQDCEVICSCNADTCSALKVKRFFPGPANATDHNYICAVDEEACLGEACGKCASACPMDAIVLMPEFSRTDESRCIGCGLCIPACPTHARAIANRAPEDTYTPPANMFVQYTQQADWRRAQATA